MQFLLGIIFFAFLIPDSFSACTTASSCTWKLNSNTSKIITDHAPAGCTGRQFTNNSSLPVLIPFGPQIDLESLSSHLPPNVTTCACTKCDCSAWSPWSAWTQWGSCSGNPRRQTRSRSQTSQCTSQCGATGCGIKTNTQTESQPCSPYSIQYSLNVTQYYNCIGCGGTGPIATPPNPCGTVNWEKGTRYCAQGYSQNQTAFSYSDVTNGSCVDGKPGVETMHFTYYCY